ncbi:hypothetical protein, partial [Streptomyces sp. NPDC054888]
APGCALLAQPSLLGVRRRTAATTAARPTMSPAGRGRDQGAGGRPLAVILARQPAPLRGSARAPKVLTSKSYLSPRGYLQHAGERHPQTRGRAVHHRVVLHRPNPADSDRSIEWYYALNDFQYRLVGEKEGDEIKYHVEVQKRYDWGIPSEHRATVSGDGPGPLGMDLEQADIAYLHSSDMAQDFNVSGSSDEMTARS